MVVGEAFLAGTQSLKGHFEEVGLHESTSALSLLLSTWPRESKGLAQFRRWLVHSRERTRVELTLALA